MPLEGGSRTSGPDVGTSVVDLRWVVLQCAHDLKRARKGQSYQWRGPPAKTSGVVGSGVVAGVLAGDRQHAPLDRVDGVAPTALDLEVGRGDRRDAGGQGVGGPAAQRTPGLVDLPRRHAEVAG